MFDINNPSSRELDFQDEIKKTLWRLSKEYVVLINGQTAAGKGTLAKSMIEACDIEVRPLSFVSTGQIYRDGLNDVGPTRFSYSAKRRIREVNDAGKLQPPELSAALVITETEKVREDDALLIIEG
jgi:adenylate kinase family enzyme